MQSQQMKPKLNCLFILVCSKHMEGICISKPTIKNVRIPMAYFTQRYPLIVSRIQSKQDKLIFKIK